MAEIRILVTGGGSTLRDRVTRTLQRFDALHLIGFQPEEIVLVHGDAAGADRLAAEEAAKLGWRTEAHTGWKQRAAGAAYCLVFPGGSGTARCRRLADNAHIPIIDVKEPRHG
jgi:hypothetical protein